jgi:hypothetical protein
VLYQMLSLSGNAAVETLEAHVLARAYRTLWRVWHRSEPAGRHVIASLDLVIDFGVPVSRLLPTDRSPSTPRPH